MCISTGLSPSIDEFGFDGFNNILIFGYPQTLKTEFSSLLI